MAPKRKRSAPANSQTQNNDNTIEKTKDKVATQGNSSSSPPSPSSPHLTATTATTDTTITPPPQQFPPIKKSRPSPPLLLPLPLPLPLTASSSSSKNLQSKPKPKPKPEVQAKTKEEAISSPSPSQQHALSLIASSPRGTPFEKRVWSLLCQIPRGSVSTYALLSRHLKSSPRAVGNACRRNPFAPEVPCHRVVATGGGLGGFKGEWVRGGEKAKKKNDGYGGQQDGKGKGKKGDDEGKEEGEGKEEEEKEKKGGKLKEGIRREEKKMLLKGEGVRIDAKERVLGTPWGAFV